MASRVLIANRGEIALRLVRACKILGKETVAVYTEVDRDLPHLALADEEVKISHYLNAEDIVMAGTTKSCDCVHPGYGLLSEDANFAQMVKDSGMVFVGPDPEHIAMLGDKIEARKIFNTFGIDAIPGSLEALESVDEVREIANEIGYPIVLKAAFGGGGRGIRAVYAQEELEEVFAISRGEAAISFGRDEVFVEKLMSSSRHIEIQILGDGDGNCIHLGTRDCSVQRRYQKIIEEAPALGLDVVRLERLTQDCLSAMSKLCYKNAATLEFLYCDGQFYFLEVNTRLQVEHPVTEAVTGIDIVAAQFHIADGVGLPKVLLERPIQFRGHAIECRILAEDSLGRPSPGLVTGLHIPGGPGVRLDSHLYVGYRVPHQYDSLLGKLIIAAEDRSTAIAKMNQALQELKVVGIETNIEQLLRIIQHPDFMDANFDTQWTPQ